MSFMGSDRLERLQAAGRLTNDYRRISGAIDQACRFLSDANYLPEHVYITLDAERVLVQQIVITGQALIGEDALLEEFEEYWRTHPLGEVQSGYGHRLKVHRLPQELDRIEVHVTGVSLIEQLERVRINGQRGRDEPRAITGGPVPRSLLSGRGDVEERIRPAGDADAGPGEVRDRGQAGDEGAASE